MLGHPIGRLVIWVVGEGIAFATQEIPLFTRNAVLDVFLAVVERACVRNGGQDEEWKKRDGGSDESLYLVLL